jgi:phosphatidylglycerol:prolipoprotein diacylglycerol transferase
VRPVLFSVRGHRVWSYPALLYVGLVCGFYALYLLAPKLRLEPGAAALALLILFVPALVGARVWFVLDHWTVYRRQPQRVWRRSEGGMTLYGGLVLALLVSPAVLGALGVGFAAFWDAATVTILVAMVFTRVGCLLNGCCAGRASDGPLSLRLPDHAGHWRRRHPVQILEMAAAVLLLAGSASLLAAGAPRGAVFVFGLAGYGCARLGLDRLRERPIPSATTHAGALTIFLTGSLVVFAAGWLVVGG